MRKLASLLCLLTVITIIGTSVPLPDSAIGSIAKIASLPALTIWFIAVISTGSIRRPHPLHYAFLLFIIWSVCSVTWSLDPPSTLAQDLRYIQSFVMCLMLWDLFRDEESARKLLYAMAIGGLLAILGTLWSAKTDTTQNAGLAGRYSGFGYNPNDIGLVLAVCLPLAWYLALRTTMAPFLVKAIGLVFPLGVMASVVFAATRGGLVAAIPGFLYVLLKIPALGRTQKICCACALLLGLFAFTRIDVSTQLQRLGSVSDRGNSDKLTGRGQIWALAAHEFTANPIVGIGDGAFPTVSDSHGIRNEDAGGLTGVVVHNTYLSVLCQLGVVGFVLFFACVAISMLSLVANKPDAWVALMMACCAWLIGVGSLTFEYRAQTWLLFSLCIVCANAVRSRPISEPIPDNSMGLGLHPGIPAGLVSRSDSGLSLPYKR